MAKKSGIQEAIDRVEFKIKEKQREIDALRVMLDELWHQEMARARRQAARPKAVCKPKVTDGSAA